MVAMTARPFLSSRDTSTHSVPKCLAKPSKSLGDRFLIMEKKYQKMKERIELEKSMHGTDGWL